MWIFPISTSFSGLNLRSSYEVNRTGVVELFLKGPITPSQTHSDYATFISNLASLQLDFHSETESQRRVPNVRYLLISNPVDYFEFYYT